MTYLDPNSLLPQYECEHHHDRLRACWPGLVAIARRKGAATRDVFHELAPLPGGFFLAGVGEAEDGSVLRNEVLAHVVAGADLKQAVRLGLRIDQTDAFGASACYASFDPIEATMRLESAGLHVSAVHLSAGTARSVRTATELEVGTPTLLALRPGEVLALIAHPRGWTKQVLSTIQRALPEHAITLTARDLHDLCTALDDLAGPTANLVFYRQEATGSSDGDGGKDSLMPTRDLNPNWTVNDLEFLDRLTGCLA
jgi:hypothetical protein